MKVNDGAAPDHMILKLLASREPPVTVVGTRCDLFALWLSQSKPYSMNFIQVSQTLNDVCKYTLRQRDLTGAC